jgi:MoaA/NifB/PqqE/SkfB family radical SAM enzyme
MVSSIRIYAPAPGLFKGGDTPLRRAGIAYEIIGNPTMLTDPAAPDTVDVLHVPAGQQPDSGRATEMLSYSSADKFGILSEDAGLVFHRVGTKALRVYYRQFLPQADEGVYVKGSDYRLLHGAQGDVPAPRQVYLGLTQRCNRSCIFCVSRTFDFDLLSVEQVKHLCAQLRGGVDVIALTGAGEAMTHPRFWEIMDLLCDRLPGVQFKLNTSGLALARKARRLLTYPVKNITVSLNAATEPTYERFVGPGFHAVLKGILSLVEARAEADRDDLHLCLSMVLMNSTVGEMSDLVTIAAELGIEEVQGIYLMINDDTLAAESPWHQPARSNELLAAATRVANGLGVRASLPPPFHEAGRPADGYQQASLPTTQGQRCTEAWSTVYVRPNGDVIACPYMERAMGNIRDQSLAEVWNGPVYRQLRDGLVSRDYCEECRHCCGFNETGSVDEYASHWIGERRPGRLLPLLVV